MFRPSQKPSIFPQSSNCLVTHALKSSLKSLLAEKIAMLLMCPQIRDQLVLICTADIKVP